VILSYFIYFVSSYAINVTTGVPSNHAIVQMIDKRFQEARKRASKSRTEVEIARLERKVKSEITNGNLKDSVETLTSLMTARKKMLKTLKSLDEDLSTGQLSTAYTLKVFGQVLTERGDKASAVRAFEDAQKLFSKAGIETGNQDLDDIEAYLKKLRGA